ncbi:MAG: hypothetical protein JO115_02200 [Pseudonocardiales bacterium]|nr:hypothetical protein [Pseudonocardiales bacterium]
MSDRGGGANNESQELSWPELIGFMAQLRMQLEQVKPRVYPMTAPHVGANPEQLVRAEQRLRHPLDPVYWEFLTYANGWPDYFQDVRLLGTEELGRGQLWDRGQQLLNTYFEDGPASPPDFPPRTDLELIAVGTETIDIHVLWITGPVTDGGHPILWLAGEEIDRWANFHEYFRSIYAYLERALERARR